MDIFMQNWGWGLTLYVYLCNEPPWGGFGGGEGEGGLMPFPLPGPFLGLRHAVCFGFPRSMFRGLLSGGARDGLPTAPIRGHKAHWWASYVLA